MNRTAPLVTRCGNIELRWGERTYIMGIVNVSPDSFSGDGIAQADAAIAYGQKLVQQGADILDVGGESTRPGVPTISSQEEINRIAPVIRGLASAVSVPISVDTSKSEVAEAVLAAGANMLNDQWGLKHDPALAVLAARYRIPIVLMSNQRDKGGYDAAIKRDVAYFANAIEEITASLSRSLDMALQAGVPRENIILDPGIGFGKTWQQDLEIIRRLEEFKKLGQPLLIGPSRKSFIGMALGLPVTERLEGTAAAVALGIAHGADMVRVHDVAQMVRVCKMSDAILRAK